MNLGEHQRVVGIAAVVVPAAETAGNRRVQVGLPSTKVVPFDLAGVLRRDRYWVGRCMHVGENSASSWVD